MTLGALAAYAFSRFRFRGRRLGMLFLLLIQMFPQPLAVTAIYLIVLRTGEVFSAIGLNTLLGLILVYLGGALGVNTWLLKGFFDTIPSELDESARVDGATPAQVFWGVVLPLAAPVLLVVGLFSFVATINEFLIASVLLATPEKFTLPLGLRQFIDQQYSEHWGPFAAGVLLAAIPVVVTLLLPAAIHRLRADAGIGEGMTVAEKGDGGGARLKSGTQPELGYATLLAEPHHDGSDLYLVERPAEIGDEAVVRLRVPRGTAVDAVALRCIVDGDPIGVRAEIDEETATDTWWRATIPMRNPEVRYRFLLTGGELGYAWANGSGLVQGDVADADDFLVSVDPGGPDWHLRSVVYEIFPDRFASSGLDVEPPGWAVPRPWDELPQGRARTTSAEWFGGDLRGIEQHLDHIEQLGADAVYMTPIFPAGSTHRYDATTFDRVDPLLGGDEALASLVAAAHGRGIRVVGDLTPNHCGSGHEWFQRALADPDAPEREFFFFDDGLKNGYECWCGVPALPKLNWGSDELRGRMLAVTRRWLEAPYALDGWRVDVANMAGRFRDVDLNHSVARWIREAAGDERCSSPSTATTTGLICVRAAGTGR